jgi:hypothetical protein
MIFAASTCAVVDISVGDFQGQTPGCHLPSVYHVHL